MGSVNSKALSARETPTTISMGFVGAHVVV
jgi:hypothetical protein